MFNFEKKAAPEEQADKIVPALDVHFQLDEHALYPAAYEACFPHLLGRSTSGFRGPLPALIKK